MRYFVSTTYARGCAGRFISVFHRWFFFSYKVHMGRHGRFRHSYRRFRYAFFVGCELRPFGERRAERQPRPWKSKPFRALSDERNGSCNMGSGEYERPEARSRPRLLARARTVLFITRSQRQDRFTGSHLGRFRRSSINRNLVFVPIISNLVSPKSIVSLIAIFFSTPVRSRERNARESRK